MQKQPLNEVLTHQTIRELAGERSFERGEEYFAEGRVRTLIEDGETITARVRGNEAYRVKLWVGAEGLSHSCDCPFGSEGAFCKHCVAVGLAWLDQATDSGKDTQKDLSATPDDIRAYLAACDPSSLVDMLMEQARSDEQLRNRLLVKATKARAKKLDVASFRAAINQAVARRGFVEYRDVPRYARGIDEVVASVEELLSEGYANEVIELSEYALKRLERAIGSVDDSDGCMGELLRRLQEIHHAACKKAGPDPETLANRLFEWEIRSEWEVFLGAAQTYADVLGDKGLAVYRRLAEAEWSCVPALQPGTEDPNRYGKRFRITHIMECLARQADDVEALVQVKSRDLSHPYAYLQIAEIYKKAGKNDLALEWAEKGVHAFPERPDSRLCVFLAEEYHCRKRHDEAMNLIWAEFARLPYLSNYQLLKEHADRTHQWPQWREKSLAYLRKSIASRKSKKEKGQDRWTWPAHPDHSVLVEIFLWEKDGEAAWREAQQGCCSDVLWMKLADIRETDHPEDAVEILKRQIEPTLSGKNNEAYREVVKLLHRIHGLMRRLGRESEFADYLNSVRAAHRIRRNFMKVLDQVKFE